MKNLNVYIVLFILFAATISAQQDHILHFKKVYPDSLFKNPEELLNKLESGKMNLHTNLKKLSEEKNIRIDEITFDAVLYDSNFNTYTQPIKYDYSYSPIGTSITLEKRKLVENEWIASKKEIENYDFDGNLIEKIYQNRTENKWKNYSRISYTYYENNSIVLKSIAFWTNGDWLTSSRDSMIYNGEGRIIYDYSEHLRNGIWTPSYESRLITENNPKRITYIETYFANEEYNDTTIYTYNESGQVLEVLQLESMGYGRRTVYEYDQEENRLSVFYMNKSNYVWENTAYHLFEYDTNNNMISQTDQRWIDNNWVNLTRYDYNYNSLNQIDTSFYSKWEDNQWMGQYRYTYKYNSMGNKVEELTAYPEDNGIRIYWYDNNRHIYEYNQNGKLIFEASQFYQHPPVNWKSSYETVYEYDENGNETFYSHKSRRGESLVEVKRRISQYNSNGLLVEAKAEKYENGWMPDFYPYLGNKIPVSSDSEISKVSINYSSYEKINYESPAKAELFQNYPNPFNPTTKIYFTLPSDGHVTVDVYNSIGQKVRTIKNEIMQKGIQSIDFNASGLASGIYFYTIKTDNFFDAKKMVFVK